MRFVITALLLLLFAAPASADDLTWQKIADKKENPDELACWVGVSDDCSISKKEVADIVEGVFVRSRIKPTANTWRSEPLYLSIHLTQVQANIEDSPAYTRAIS